MKNLLFLALISHSIFAQNPPQEPIPNTIKGITMVSLSVKDVQKAENFYSQVQGLTFEAGYRISGSVNAEKLSNFPHKARTGIILKGPNGKIELIAFDGSAKKANSRLPVQGPGITHVCYQAPMNHDIYSEAKKAKATIVSRGDAPVNRGFGIHYAYIRDKDNIMFEVEQTEKPKFIENVWLGHVAIVTPDIERLVAFYTEFFGVKPYAKNDNIRNQPKLDDIANIDSLHLKGAWFKTNGMNLELWQFDNPKVPVTTSIKPFTAIGYQKICIEVGNLEQEYTRLKAKGVNFLSEPDKNSLEVFLRDPDGNLILTNQSLLT